MPELMSQVLWAKLGARTDATIGVDSVGTGMFDGGINACLSDLVRFGSLFLNGGTSLTGERVVSLSWIADTFAGGLDSRSAFAASPGDNRMPGGCTGTSAGSRLGATTCCCAWEFTAS